MKQILISVLLGCPFVLFGQEGITFEKGLSWEEVQNKAGREHKTIFVDCMASWCAPCKKMDKEVYANKEVAAFFNDRFISVKLQFDTSKQDDEDTRLHYSEASQIGMKYNITAFPTFLFFSSEGKIIHRGLGYKKVKDFIKLGLDALDPGKQYYTLLENYLAGKKDYSVMPFLAESSKQIRDKSSLATTIARDYIDNYLMSLPVDSLFKKETFRFVSSFMGSSDEKAFALYFTNPARIDSVMDDLETSHFAERVVKSIITREEVYVHLWKDNEVNRPLTDHPRWNRFAKTIRKKYGRSYSDEVIMNSRIVWYRTHKQWDELVGAEMAKMEIYGVDTFGTVAKVRLNNMAWEEFFLRSLDSSALNSAIKWMEILLAVDRSKSGDFYATWIDTYANLLYKVGRIEEALRWEKDAVAIAPQNKEMRDVLEKMEKGKPTWVNQD
jgi:thioredoxin-related protein